MTIASLVHRHARGNAPPGRHAPSRYHALRRCRGGWRFGWGRLG